MFYDYPVGCESYTLNNKLIICINEVCTKYTSLLTLIKEAVQPSQNQSPCLARVPRIVV